MTEKNIENGNVTRYCKPKWLDDNNFPTSDAFRLRHERSEEYLSVYLLEFFKKPNGREGVLAAKTYMENRLRPSKRSSFAVLNIESVLKEISTLISFREKGLPHGGIFFQAADEMVVSELLVEHVKSNYLTIELR